MKHSVSKKVLLLVLSFVVISATCMAAQSHNVTISKGQITVANLIREVEKQTDYLLVYNAGELNLNKTVTVEANNESAVSVLASALQGTGVTPKIEGRNIVLAKSQAPQAESLVSGVVVDESGEPIVGASIIIKGTKNGTFTDVDGKFTLSAQPGAVLEVSSIGYVSQEITAGRTPARVVLKVDNELLDETIVIGYGTAKKRDYIGSVSTIKSEDISKVNPTSLESTLQGMAAGVQVNGNNGVPGAPQQVKVRGVGSLSCSTDPLWIVDGIPVQSGAMDSSYDGETQQSIIGMLNPNDIESIQVLKDAAATAIYGSRAANGVIVVTTKSGKKGTPKVTVDLKGGVSTWAHSDIGLANTTEWFQIADMAMKNTAGASGFDVATTYSQLPNVVHSISTAEAKNVNTNWVDEISRLGSYSEANVSISGGAEKMRSYASFRYRKDNGNLRNNDMTTFAGNVKLDWDITKWFDLSYRLAASYTDNNRIKSSDGTNGSGGWAQINSNALPWYKVYADAAETEYWNPKNTTNPVASMAKENMVSNLKTMNVISNLTGTVKLPVDGLSIKGDWGLNYVITNGQSWRSASVMSTTDQNIAKENKNIVTINNLDAYLNYAKTFGKAHDISAVAGVEGMRRGTQYTNLTGTGLVGKFQEIGTPNKLTGSSGFGAETYLLSYFFRANYKLLDRYIVNFSARRDGSSKFTEANRWSNFYSGALGWVISEEPWFNSDAINLLKLRASIGQVGNANIPQVDSDVYEIVTENGSTLEGLATSRLKSLGNPNLRWETTTSYDAGVDFGLYNNRVNGSIAYYRRNVSDMLSQVSLPMSAGIRGGNKGWQNACDMFNQGVEFEVMGTLIQKKDFEWNLGFNISTNMNQVTRLDEDSDRNNVGYLNAGDASQVRTIIKSGLAYGTYYMAESAGVDAQKGIPMIYEVETLADGTTKHTGNVIPATSTNMEANKMILKGKTALPKFVGGLNTSVRFHGFDASAVFSFATGQYIYSRLLQSSMTPNAGMLVLNRKLLTDSWQKPGDITDVPQVNAQCVYFYDDKGEATTDKVLYGSENKTPSSRFLEKADYLKLRTLTLGYTIPAKAVQALNIQNVRFYLSAGNLFTLTPFSGYDPEVAVDQATGGAIETFTAMPSTRTYTFGVNLNF